MEIILLFLMVLSILPSGYKPNAPGCMSLRQRVIDYADYAKDEDDVMWSASKRSNGLVYLLQD